MNDSGSNTKNEYSNSLASSRKNFASSRVQNTRSFLNASHASHQGSHSHGNLITPHSRTYSINSPHLIRHPTNSSNNMMSSEQSDLIYGTTISAKNVMEVLEAFIKEFELTREMEIQQEMVSEKIYYSEFNDLDLMEKTVLSVQGSHLKEFDRELYYQFIYFPVEMISIFDETLQQMYEKLFIQTQNDPMQVRKKMMKKSRIMCAIQGLDQVISMRNITHQYINRLVAMRGIVIRCSDIYPDMKAAMFRCSNCKNKVHVVLQNAKVSEPKACDHCKMKETMEIQHNLCEFTDKQFIKFQELPELVPEGETPSSLTLITYDQNVDKVRPGDRIQIVGIYRVSDSKIFKNRKAIKSIFNSHLDVISYGAIKDCNNMKIQDGESGHLTVYNDSDKNMFAEMADSPTILSDLIDSFAPSIFGNEEIKKGLLAQLFAGTKKDFTSVGRNSFRSDINICLVGDPSTAKSQLLQQVHKISPRGIYTSGRGSSAVGLTANVRRDPQTKEFVLESGALVLSDLGICCIDEFDKMDVQSRLILLEAMEQQTISIAKAGIVCQLNSRAAILCAANPVNSKYNPKKSVIENINLTPALLTRFDLIYIMLDQPNEAYDHRLATHILSLYSTDQASLNAMEIETYHSQRDKDKKKGQGNQGFKYSKDVMSKYITYAKQYVHPQLTEQSGQKLIEAYSEMRKLGSNKKVITATTRQLESLIRISESFAKMRLSSLVEQKDVDQAIALVKYATQQAATDPTTGLIDMDVIVTGKTSSSRQRINKIKEITLSILKANITRYSKNSNLQIIAADVNKRWEDREKVQEKEMLQALRVLESQGFVVIFGPSKLRPLFKLAKDMR